MSSRPDEVVPQLVGSAQLDIGIDGNRVHSLQKRVHELHHRDRLVGFEPFREVVTLEHLGERHLGGELEDVGHVELRQPFGVVPDLEKIVVVPDEHLLEAVEDVLGVAPHFGLGQPLAGFTLAGRVTDLGREVTDDEHGLVPLLLEVAKLAKHDGPSECHLGSGWIHPELHPQRLAFGDPFTELVLGNDGV